MVGSSLKNQDPDLHPKPQRFYTEKWITDPEYIPSNPLDLAVLRTRSARKIVFR